MRPRKRKVDRSGERSIATLRRTTTKANNNAQSAADKVFNIAELLEMILVNVGDMQTLLLGQRVNRMWLEVTSKNKQLQQKLFMAPATGKEVIALNIPVHVNIRNGTEGAQDLAEVPKALHDKTSRRVLVSNPLIFRHKLNSVYHAVGVELSRLVGAGRDVKPGSWQRMYATMPPPRSLYLRVSAKSKRGYGSVHSINGRKTVGEVMECIETRLMQDGQPQPVWAKSEFGLPWHPSDRPFRKA
ncbi:hypothetical protein LTR56_020728 [Elasticomyces elasticus]|nr:hypothetical protein LTR56_020728 [Elasticomyces elasticus]KAK3632590.1 hypothetical protein LTR22_020526 [Elasticomyces elasticus]KAK4914966.1 hypothetical protein LTR49_016831 [Elasticomyces elasticus]KAK5748655.1 hypothetical protein LTS12_021288 [Elasticomyces elasticus]